MIPFRYRTGRAIATSRFVLASVFLLAIYIDPSQPSAAPDRVYFMLTLYVLVALGMMVVASRSWWWDNRLALAMHIIDLSVFALVVFSTDGYTSPFFTFSLFLLLSAAMRWGGSETARTAVACNVLFLIAGLMSGLLEATEIDGQRLVIRATYLAVLSALCVWFTFDRDRLAARPSLPRRLHGSPAGTDLIEVICDHLYHRTAATRIACVLRDDRKPRVRICLSSDSAQSWSEGEEIEDLLATLPGEPFLFDPMSGRMLVGSAQSARPFVAKEMLKQFCTEHRLENVLGFAVRGEDLECGVFIGGLPAVNVDDLTTGAELAEEITFLHGQSVLNILSRQAATNRARLSIARDLHDSVAQIVAGISFRLEGFKRSGKPAAEFTSDLDVLQTELAAEQRMLRSMITDLRRPVDAQEPVKVVGYLSGLAGRLGRQWGISCTFAGSADLRFGKEFERELSQMIREGVANAVRHGAAKNVSITLHDTKNKVALEITDNGSGWSLTETALPRSLNERALALGGTLETVTSPDGTIVRIHIPKGAVA